MPVSNLANNLVMQKIFTATVVATLALMAIACNKVDPLEGAVERKFYLNAELTEPEEETGTYIKWNKGEKTVFRFVLTHPDDKDIADDELSEIFWIEIPNNIPSFEYDSKTDSGLGEMELYYTRACYCYFEEGFNITSVRVKGSKLNQQQWSVEFEMESSGKYGDYGLEDKGTYTIDTFDWD